MITKLFKGINKKGFTLLEILLAITILAIATIGVGSVILSTQNNTAEMFNEAELQQQLVEAQESLHNELLSTTVGIKYWTKSTAGGSFQKADGDVGGEFEKLVAFYSIDNVDFNLHKVYFRYNASDRTLEMATLVEPVTKKTATGPQDIQTNVEMEIEVDNNVQSDVLDKIGDGWTTVAHSVEEFSLNFANYEKNKLISYNISIESDGVSYPTDDTVYIRNEIKINDKFVIDKFHTVFIEKPSLDKNIYSYNGETHKPGYVNYLERYMTITSGSTLSASEQGTYTITFSLKDKDSTKWTDGTTGDVVCTWVINAKTAILQWGTLTWDYDKKEHSTTCTVTNLESGDACTVIFEGNKIGPNVGTATVKVTGLSNKNYKLPSAEECTRTLTIKSISPTVTIKTVERTYINDGVLQDMVEYSNLEGGSLRYYISTSSTAPNTSQVSETKCQAKNAGTYYVWYRIVAANSNYVDTQVFSLGSVKMLRSPTATAASEDKVYNGKSQSGMTGKYVIESGDWTGTNVGTYYASATPDSNHLWANGKDNKEDFTWKITKAAGSLTAPKAITNLVYNTKAQELITAGSSSTGTMYYRVNSGSWGTSIPTGTNAGSYYVEYKSVGDSNHFDTEVGSFTVTIEKAAGYCTAPTAKTNLVYTGSPQTLINAATNATGEVLYKADSGSYSTTLPSGTDAKTYTIYYKVEESANYKAVAEKNFTVTIAKANGTITVLPTAKTNLVYNTTAQALINGGTTSTGTLYYRVDGGAWDTNIPKKTNAGTYKVEYYLKGDSNHNDIAVSASTTFSITIAKANGSCTAPTAKTLTYTGSAQTLINAATNATGDVSYKLGSTGTYSASLPTATAAGTYTVYYKVAESANYKAVAEKTVSVTISQKKGSVTTKPTGKTLSCTGANQDLISAGAGTGTMMYSVNGGTASSSIPKASAAGTYTITYYAAASSNYTQSDSGTVTTTISHTYKDTVTKPTCTAKGYTTHTCTGCKYSYNDTETAIVASAHTGTSTYGGTSGVHTKYTCCGATISASHTYDQNSGVQYTAATCTAKRKNYKSCICGYNPKNSSYTVEVGSANGHTSANGGTATVHKKCSVCGATTEDGSKHSYSSEVQTAANCTTKGTTKYTCGCGYSYTSQDIAINSSKHTGSSTYGGTSGVHTKYSCCGATISSSHTYNQDSGVQYTAATCTAKRKNYKSCICGYNPKNSSHVVETGSANGHTEVNGGTATVHKKCSVCSATLEDGSKHNYNQDSGVQYKAATCTAKRKNYKSCACGYNPKSSSYVVETGSKDSSNHTGNTVYGGTSSKHTKYDCCDATSQGSSYHSYDQKSGVLYKAATVSAAAQYYYSCVCGYNPQSASYVYSSGSPLGFTVGDTITIKSSAVYFYYTSQYQQCCEKATYSYADKFSNYNYRNTKVAGFKSSGGTEYSSGSYGTASASTICAIVQWDFQVKGNTTWHNDQKHLMNLNDIQK